MFPGTKRFSIVEEVGRGATGVVFRARDEELGAEVALKTLTSVSADGLAELKREFRSCLEMSHPNLVQLHELFVEAGTPFFTMELVRGEDIVTSVRGDLGQGEVPTGEARARFFDVALSPSWTDWPRVSASTLRNKAHAVAI